jgi:hypothetical protein
MACAYVGIEACAMEETPIYSAVIALTNARGKSKAAGAAGTQV